MEMILTPGYCKNTMTQNIEAEFAKGEQKGVFVVNRLSQNLDANSIENVIHEAKTQRKENWELVNLKKVQRNLDKEYAEKLIEICFRRCQAILITLAKI